MNRLQHASVKEPAHRTSTPAELKQSASGIYVLRISPGMDSEDSDFEWSLGLTGVPLGLHLCTRMHIVTLVIYDHQRTLKPRKPRCHAQGRSPGVWGMVGLEFRVQGFRVSALVDC